MRVRAYYFASDDAEAVPCYVRVHTKFTQLGDQKGTSLNSAETEETAPRLLFWREELQPVRNSVIIILAEDSLSGGVEGYRLGVVLPPDGLTITARVSELRENEIAAYEV